MTAGAMDLDDQWKLARVIEEYGTNNLFVLLGCPDAESSQIQAETVSTGDPSMVGPLTDRSFHLQVAHVAEPEVKKIISPKIFDRCIQQFLSRVDVAAIAQRMNEVRARARQSG